MLRRARRRRSSTPCPRAMRRRMGLCAGGVRVRRRDQLRCAAPASTRDDLGSTPRGKTSRSFSEDAQSVQVAPARRGVGERTSPPACCHVGAGSSTGWARVLLLYVGVVRPCSAAGRARVAHGTLSVQQRGREAKAVDSSRASSSAQFDSSVSMQCSSASSHGLWDMLRSTRTTNRRTRMRWCRSTSARRPARHRHHAPS